MKYSIISKYHRVVTVIAMPSFEFKQQAKNLSIKLPVMSVFITELLLQPLSVSSVAWCHEALAFHHDITSLTPT